MAATSYRPGRADEVGLGPATLIDRRSMTTRPICKISYGSRRADLRPGRHLPLRGRAPAGRGCSFAGSIQDRSDFYLLAIRVMGAFASTARGDPATRPVDHPGS